MRFNSYFEKFSTKLTQQQQSAVQCSLGPALVIAGAGSGKTSVIAHRFIYLVHNFNIDPERILLVTFTNHASRNIKSRINQYMCEWMNNAVGRDLPAPIENIQSMTFHAICKQILDWVCENKESEPVIKYSHERYYTPVLKEIMQEYPHIKSVAGARDILVRLRFTCKSQNRTFTEEEFIDVAMDLEDVYEREKILQKYPYGDMVEIYVKFDEEMKRKGMGTLDDIILNANNYLRFDREVMGEWRNRFDAILCDEFQDVDDLQFNVLTQLCSQHDNLFCVGDPDQAIYGFRGSLPQVFLKLKSYFDQKGVYTQIKKLEQNFRSTPQILHTANRLINASNVSDELRKNLVTDRGSGPRPEFEAFKSATLQSKAVVKKIEELQKQGVQLSEIAILSRKRSNYTRIKNDFLFRSIQYEDYKEVFGLLRGEAIRDVVGWMSVAFVDPNSDQWLRHLKRVYNKPSSGVGPVAFMKMVEAIREGDGDVMKSIMEFAYQSDKFTRFIFKINQLRAIAKDETKLLRERYWEIAVKCGIVDYYAEKLGTDSEKLDTIQKFLNSPLVSKSQSWQDALEHVERYLDVTSNKNRVACSTIHGVKGLEFRYVFIVSMSDGNIPTSKGLKLCKTDAQRAAYIDEERRVFYVAITRAKDQLYIYSDKEEVSLFIQDIADCVDGEITVPVQEKKKRGRPRKTEKVEAKSSEKKTKDEKVKKTETTTKGKKTKINYDEFKEPQYYDGIIGWWEKRVDILEVEYAHFQPQPPSKSKERVQFNLKIARNELKIVTNQQKIAKWINSMKKANSERKQRLKEQIYRANSEILNSKRNIEVWEEYLREMR